MSFFPDPLSLTLPSLTLETTSGICELNRDLFLTKEKIQESMQCLAWWQCFWIKWCWSLGAGQWLFCKLKKRYKTQVHEDIIKKKNCSYTCCYPSLLPCAVFIYWKCISSRVWEQMWSSSSCVPGEFWYLSDLVCISSLLLLRHLSWWPLRNELHALAVESSVYQNAQGGLLHPVQRRVECLPCTENVFHA